MKVKEMIEKLLDGMRRMDCRSVASLGLDFSHIALHSVSVAFVCNIICVHGTLFQCSYYGEDTGWWLV